MPRCCSGGCNCNIQAGPGVVITGTGGIDDPFIIGTEVGRVSIPDAVTVQDAPESGQAEAPPAQPAGYLSVEINGEDRVIPFY